MACNHCDERGRLNAARLVAEHCPHMSVPVLLRTIAAECSGNQAAEVRDVCGIHLPQLLELRLRGARTDQQRAVLVAFHVARIPTISAGAIRPTDIPVNPAAHLHNDAARSSAT